MTIAVVDYGSGNLRSVAKALERAGRESGHEEPVLVTTDPEAVRRADRIVLPGVGAFAECIAGLKAADGIRPALREAVIDRGVPFLGICVGMQAMASVGHEHGDHLGLDWIDGAVVPLAPCDPELVVPHMGWNTLAPENGHPVLEGLGGKDVYFAHSYVFVPADPGDMLAMVEYGGWHAAAIGRDNLAGVQFHPEKSQAAGLRLLANFLAWRP